MSGSKAYLCVAYGGATALCPPGHTMAAIRKALELGASMIYVEVRTVRGGDLVAWPSMQRLLLGEPVHMTDYSLAEWTHMTADDDAPVLPLDDVLTLASRTRCGIALDIHAEGIEHQLARKLKDFGIAYDAAMVISTEPTRPLVRMMNPKIATGHRFRMDHQASITPALINSLDVDAVFWPHQIITPGIVNLLKQRGVMVYSGQVNLAHEMRRLRDDCGVDGIITPYPEILLDLPVKHQSNFRNAA